MTIPISTVIIVGTLARAANSSVFLSIRLSDHSDASRAAANI
jgi:hypothetical protein